MRAALLAVLGSGTLWCQVERDCKAPKQVICTNPRVKALDEAFEKKLGEVNQEASTWDPFIDTRLHAMWDREVVACLQKEDCIRAVYNRRLEFLKNLRVAAKLDPGPADMRTSLAQLNPAELTKTNLYEALTSHPILAPAAAVHLGTEWMSWVEFGFPQAKLQALPGGRWLIGKGSSSEKDAHHDLYVAIDLRSHELSFVFYQDYFGELYEPFRDLSWTSTSGKWSPETSAVLARLGGRLWEPANARTVGLPSTRMDPFPRPEPDCGKLQDTVQLAICRNQELRSLSKEVDRMWEDLYVLSLISESEYRNFPTAWASENAECSKRAEGTAPCLKTLYERRKVFVKSERIAQGLDQLPVTARAELAKIRTDLPEGGRHFGTSELLTIHPVIAPLAASILGPDWLDWSLASDGGGWPDPEPGERWIVALGFMAHNVVTSQVYLVVDLAEQQLYIVRAQEYFNPPSRQLQWASTAAGWPAALTKVLASTGGAAFENGLNRQIGLPSTRARRVYQKIK